MIINKIFQPCLEMLLDTDEFFSNKIKEFVKTIPQEIVVGIEEALQGNFEGDNRFKDVKAFEDGFYWMATINRGRSIDFRKSKIQGIRGGDKLSLTSKDSLAKVVKKISNHELDKDVIGGFSNFDNRGEFVFQFIYRMKRKGKTLYLEVMENASEDTKKQLKKQGVQLKTKLDPAKYLSKTELINAIVMSQ